MELVRKLVAVCQAHRSKRIARQAIRIAETLPEGSELADYAHSLAAQELRKVLHAEARTHIGRIARG
jgi:hypothetical protein